MLLYQKLHVISYDEKLEIPTKNDKKDKKINKTENAQWLRNEWQIHNAMNDIDFRLP